MTRCANHTKSVLTQQRSQVLVEKIIEVGVSWAEVVDNRVPAILTVATAVKISSSVCDSTKTKHLTSK